MATSGVYSFSVTRDDIIRQALLNIGKMDPDDTISSVQVSDASLVLNMMVKQWMGKTDFAPGLKVWTRKHGHLFLSNITGRYLIGPGATGWTNSYVFPVLTASTPAASATLVLSSTSGISGGYFIGIEQTDGSLFWTTVQSVASPNVTLVSPLPVGSSIGSQVFAYQTVAQQALFIETAVLRDQNLVDTPIKMLTVQDYDMLSNKSDPTNIQDPTAIYYETQLGNSYLYTDAGAAQDVTKHLVLTYMEPVQDFTTALDNPHYPQEWYLTLCWGLGKQICPQYNRVWTPLMEENFITSLKMSQQKDAEKTSLFFQPGAED